MYYDLEQRVPLRTVEKTIAQCSLLICRLLVQSMLLFQIIFVNFLVVTLKDNPNFQGLKLVLAGFQNQQTTLNNPFQFL